MIFVDYPGHLVAALLVVAFAVLVFLAFRTGELRGEKLRRHRPTLILLQYTSILILLLILWNPSQTKVSNTPSSNTILAIFDTSESMSVAEDEQSTRLDKALDVFEERFRPQRKDRSAYRIFGFDGRSYHSGSPDFLRRWGAQTDLHSVFTMLGRYNKSDAPSGADNSLSSSAGTPDDATAGDGKVAGAIVFTDGQADDKNLSSYVTPENRDFPLVLVGVGSRARQPDIAITSIEAPPRIAIDTACTVSATVAAKNMPEKAVTVELLKDNQVTDSRQVPANAFAANHAQNDLYDGSVTVEFGVAGERLGSCVYSVRAKPFDREANQANNVRSTIIEVVEETRLRVLFYSHAVNFNIGKVRQALAGDEKIQLDLSLDVIRRPALAEKASSMCGYVKLPADRQGFYAYDIIILGPCDMEALTKVQVDSLYSFVVDRGGGLILLPGKADFGPAAWINSKAKTLIPVVFDPDEPTIWPSRPEEIELTLEGIDSNILGPEALDEYKEPALPYYRIPFSKPAATTLLSVGQTPVVSIHRVGRGKVCLLNATKLFQWYREDLEGGLLSKVMAGLTAQMGKVTSREAGIELFAERIDGQPDTVKFQAYVCDDSFEPVAGANVLLSIGDKVLSMVQTGRGYYVAEIKGAHAQATVATAQAEVNGVFLGERTIAVNLPPTRTEMTTTDLDEAFLRALAKKVNGKYFHIDEIEGDPAQMLESRAGTATSRSLTSIWPNWLLLATLCALLSINWFLRRSIGLV